MEVLHERVVVGRRVACNVAQHSFLCSSGLLDTRSNLGQGRERERERERERQRERERERGRGREVISNG